MPRSTVGSGVTSSDDSVKVSKLRDQPKVATTPTEVSPTLPRLSLIPPERLRGLLPATSFGSIIFPGCKAYEQATFIGNLLYRFTSPSVVVQAVSVEDVRATVKFAVANRMKISVKSGGHSMGGYCLNYRGIVLDLSAINQVQINDKDVASIGGGALWSDVYRKCKETDLQLVAIGGNCPSVGVSAFLMGGGVSPFSRKFGLGTDNLLEMTIVTADGEVVTVPSNNELDDKKTRQRKLDLFWAIRGGGGGNFGVTVHVKVQLRRLENKNGTIVGGNLTWSLDPGSQQEKDFKSMMNVFNSRTWPELVRADALWHYDERNQLLGKMTIVYNGDRDKCFQTIAPLLKFNPKNELAPMHWTDWEVIDGKVDVFEKTYHHHASFIFGEGAITGEVTNIITNLISDDTITKHDEVDSYILWHHIGCKTTEKSSGDTAFFWRQGFYVFHLKVIWAETSNPKLVEDVKKFFDRCKTQLSKFSLQQKAAYVNYIDPTVMNWGQVYYGDNYPKLCQIKSDWDPNQIFSFPQGIRGTPPARSTADDRSWSQFSLPTPDVLGHPKTADEMFSIGADIRRAMIGIQNL